MKYFVAFILLFSVVLLGMNSQVCAQGKNNQQRSVLLYSKDDLYADAVVLMNNGDLKKSAEKFHKINTLYPFSDTGMDSLVISSFLYYISNSYLDAALGCETYINFYPHGGDIEYMYYLRAMSMFMKIRNGYTNPDYPTKAKVYFLELLHQFPNSKYTQDANNKLRILDEILLGYELSVGKFYMNNGSYAAAIPRFQSVIKNYSVQNGVEEAYYRLFEAYCFLKVKDEAMLYLNKLEAMAQQSKWLRYANAIAPSCTLDYVSMN